MPPATPEQYREMLDAAQRRNYAYPAVNVSSSDTLNAALRGFAEAGSDGIIQVSIGAADAPCRIAGATRPRGTAALPLADVRRLGSPARGKPAYRRRTPAQCRAADVILELEVGLVGGEEDEFDNDGADPDRLYSTPADTLAVAQALGTGDRGRYLLASERCRQDEHRHRHAVRLHPCCRRPHVPQLRRSAQNRRRRRRQEEVRPAGLERRRTEGDGRPRP
jgi:fructose-bisphosphate aldolase class II